MNSNLNDIFRLNHELIFLIFLTTTNNYCTLVTFIHNGNNNKNDLFQCLPKDPANGGV